MAYTSAEVAIINRALQTLGTRTTVTTTEMDNLTTNEAIQTNLIFTKYRDQLLRMAPWGGAMRYANLIYITSAPGTPENTSAATSLWQPGQPPPPWSYEYLYPDDCLRACFIIPANQTGFASGVPITTAVTGGAPAFWNGPPVRFKEATDTFREATGITLVAAGSGYQVGEKVIFGGKPTAGEVPAGLVYANVDSLSGSGIATLSLTDFTNLGSNSLLFAAPTYTLSQVYTNGFGSGATITVDGVNLATFIARVLLTNQEDATLAYVRQIIDPAMMDSLFIESWVRVLGAGLQFALRDDKALANILITQANGMISEARKADGNEGLTINNPTPDFIRIRGWADPGIMTGPFSQFDWGASWPSY